MSAKRAWSILAAGVLVAGCATAGKREPAHGGSDTEHDSAGDAPNAFPAQVDAQESAAAASNDFAGDDSPSTSVPAPAPPAESAADGAAVGASGAPRAEASERSTAPAKRTAPALDVERERPGLGTAWGETRTSHVSNAAFERSSSNPFSLTTLHYNDASGVSALLRGASPVAFRSDTATTVSNGAVTVRLVDANGNPLPTFASARGPLVQGEVGERYQIELVNLTASRFEAVVTVDGLDVIDGRPGAFEKRGYLLEPFATVDIDGFRQSMDEVAAFRFGSVRGSYAAQKGNDRNVGVVGVALFAERGSAWSARELRRRESADPFPGRFASPPFSR